MNYRLSQLIMACLTTQIVACASTPGVEGTPTAASQPLQLDGGSPWNGASVSELVAVMGTPSETLNAMPEHGLAPTLSWYSNSEDYAALELLEIESTHSTAAQPSNYGRLVDGRDSHECQIHAKLSADGLRVEQLTRQSIGDCERWLPMPNRLSPAGTMTAAVDE